MKIDILTIFPEMFSPLYASITGRAASSGALELGIWDIREYSENKHKKTDDYPFGGGAGMVMTCQPIFAAAAAADPERAAHRIYLSPKGKRLTQRRVTELARLPRLLLLCGRYEGVDERALELCMDEEISIGDYVLTGGELPAMVLVDCVSRYLDGVLGSGESVREESFAEGLLEYPHYTRPEVFMGKSVPKVLLSGNHAEIARWRREKSLELTALRRPDLLESERREK